MKIHTLLLTLALGGVASIASTPAYSQNVCASFLCMAGKTQGKSNVKGCTSPVQAYFSHSLYIYDEESIDWPLTAANRNQWLMQCPGATGKNSAILLKIFLEYGERASG